MVLNFGNTVNLLLMFFKFEFRFTYKLKLQILLLNPKELGLVNNKNHNRYL